MRRIVHISLRSSTLSITLALSLTACLYSSGDRFDEEGDNDTNSGVDARDASTDERDAGSPPEDDAGDDSGSGETPDAGDESDSGDEVDAGNEDPCGNGVKEAAEECDQGDLDGQSCQTLGFERGILRCTPQCTLDDSACDGVPVECGNGDLSPNEECEGFDFRGKTCQTEGFYGGDLACSDMCRLDTSGCEGECGDGTVNGPEVCDDGRNTGTYGSCSADCSRREAFCGDGQRNGPEVCDDGTNDGSYGGCEPGCAARGPFCGDGSVDPSEQCDPLGASTSCGMLGFYPRGTTSCDANTCTSSTDACETFSWLGIGDDFNCADNANEAMRVLDIALPDPDHPNRWMVNTWATQAALSRPGRRKYSKHDVEQIKFFTLEPETLHWPRGRIE